MSRFGIAVLKPAHGKKAVKRRLLEPNGALVKSDHTLFVKMWLMANVSVPNDADSVAELLRGINSSPTSRLCMALSRPGFLHQNCSRGGAAKATARRALCLMC